MRAADYVAAIVEAEEFAGGPMTLPGDLADEPEEFFVRDGCVRVKARSDGSWFAECARCGSGCGATAYVQGVDDDDDYPDDRVESFTAEHRDCPETTDTPPAPSPAAMPRTAPRQPTMWVVQQSSGGQIRVQAERHTTYARPDGTELRFHNGDGDTQHRVATVRAGSWHWVCAETALNSGSGES